MVWKYGIWERGTREKHISYCPGLSEDWTERERSLCWFIIILNASVIWLLTLFLVRRCSLELLLGYSFHVPLFIGGIVTWLPTVMQNVNKCKLYQPQATVHYWKCRAENWEDFLWSETVKIEKHINVISYSALKHYWVLTSTQFAESVLNWKLYFLLSGIIRLQFIVFSQGENHIGNAALRRHETKGHSRRDGKQQSAEQHNPGLVYISVRRYNNSVFPLSMGTQGGGWGSRLEIMVTVRVMLGSIKSQVNAMQWLEEDRYWNRCCSLNISFHVLMSWSKLHIRQQHVELCQHSWLTDDCCHFEWIFIINSDSKKYKQSQM